MAESWLGDLVTGTLQLLYPAVCSICLQSLKSSESHFCESCRTQLTTDPHATCPRCASTVGPFAAMENGCNRCRDAHYQFSAAIRLGLYDGLLRQVILRIKHQADEGLAELLGELWAVHAETWLKEVRADVVIPIPLHWWRRWERGYNQSESLARALAGHLKLIYRPGWLRRIRNTPKQALQSAAVRRENVRGAFAAKAAGLAGKTVLLVDDVLTTGSTCSEAAAVLRRAGAERVVVAVLAHDRG